MPPTLAGMYCDSHDLSEVAAYYKLKADFKGEVPFGKQSSDEWFEALVKHLEETGDDLMPKKPERHK